MLEKKGKRTGLYSRAVGRAAHSVLPSPPPMNRKPSILLQSKPNTFHNPLVKISPFGWWLKSYPNIDAAHTNRNWFKFNFGPTGRDRHYHFYVQLLFTVKEHLQISFGSSVWTPSYMGFCKSVTM